MAEVRLCCGRGVLDAALRISQRSLLTARRKHGKRALQPPLLSAALLLSEPAANDASSGQSAVKEPAGLPPPPGDGYTRVRDPGVGSSGDAGGASGHKHHLYFPSNRSSLYRKHCEAGGKSVGRGAVALTSQTMLTSRAAGGHCGHVLVFTRAYSGNGARDEPLYRSKTGYYELLEVSPSATHAQIKTAYYKQSFLFHPDRNAGSDEATARFSDISEAYTVLGNKGLRRKYDRGLLSAADLTAGVRPSARTAGAGKAHSSDPRRSVTGVDNRSAFDFDQFFRAHYSEQLQRDKDIRVRKEEMLKRKEAERTASKMDRVAELGVLGLLVLALGLIISLRRA